MPGDVTRAAGILIALGVALAVLAHGVPGAGAGGQLGDALRVLARPVALFGFRFPTGELLGLACALGAVAVLATPRRRGRGRPVSPGMGFGNLVAADPEPGRPWAAPAVNGAAAVDEIRPVLRHLRDEARNMSGLAAACVAVLLLLLGGTSGVDPARYAGHVWTLGWPYVLGASLALLLAAAAFSRQRWTLANRRARLALALAHRADRDELGLALADLEDPALWTPARWGWGLVLLAVVLYTAAALAPWVPALAWPPPRA
ncbi:MAG TPA: hypothetical protein VFC42_06145 [Methylomirabilota bacterium]|nr:hypothetical protein [Methylomirabilota bacterium]